MRHLCAYYASVAASQTNSALTPVADTILSTRGNFLVIPEKMQVRRVFGFGLGLVNARINVPTFRQLALPRLYPLVSAATIPDNPPIIRFGDYGPQIMAADPLGFDVTTDSTAGPNAQWVLSWLGNELPEAPKGEVYTVQATASATLATGTWVNATPTLEQDLPSGRYAIIGMEAYGTSLWAARVSFPGGGARPGVLCQQAAGQFDLGNQRFGLMGKLGEFLSTSIPTIDFLGTTGGASQTVLWDLLRLGNI